MIHIFTLMTGPYNIYLEKQIETIQYLFPNKEKTFTVISDLDNQYNKYDISKYSNLITFYWFKILDLPYAFLNALNVYFLVKALDLLEYNDNDLYLYFDADTMYLEKTPEFYDQLYNQFINYDLILNSHPGNVYYENFGFWENPGHAGYCDRKTDHNIYVQTSFFGGNIKTLKSINIDILKLLNLDLSKDMWNRHMPPCAEETYINKILNDHINGDRNVYRILIERYAQIECNPDFLQDTVFVAQKYCNHLKQSKRDNINYIIE